MQISGQSPVWCMCVWGGNCMGWQQRVCVCVPVAGGMAAGLLACFRSGAVCCPMQPKRLCGHKHLQLQHTAAMPCRGVLCRAVLWRLFTG